MGAITAHDLDIPTLDLAFEPDREVASATLRAAGARSWIARNPLGYSILHYDDVVAMLRDKRWHSATSKIMELSGITDPQYLSRRRTSILSAEGDDHTRLRRLVGPAFSPRAADRLRPFMREVVNGLVDGVAPHGRADVAVDICEPYPIPIICELLGAPKEDWKQFSRWDTRGGLPPPRRSRPADDLLTDLIAAEEEGDTLTTAELVMMVEAVIVAGTDTTRNQLGCAVALFADHPEQWKLLAEQPELAPRAVEETMRYFGAVRGTGRFASEDIVYRGVLFPKGTFIAPSMATANRDPDVFADPGTFDIPRQPSGQP